MFKLALAQMLVEGGEPDRNLSRAGDRITEAASQGADFVLLPETMDLGWTHSSAKTGAQPIPDGTAFQQLAKFAAEHRVHLCAGLTERDGDDVFNSAVIIDDTGKLLLKHRKLNELEIGHEYYTQGDRLNVCRTRFGTIGLMICADGFAKDCVVSRSLGYMGADLILSPSAWAVPADHDNSATPYGQLWRDSYIPVAREFSMWIASASNVGPITDGPWKGRKCIGCSLVIDANGYEIVQGPYGESAETILYVDIDPVARPARGDGWSSLKTS